MFRVGVCVLAIVICGGCSTVQKPTASYKSMTIKEVSASGFTMAVDVDIQNPNSVALPLANADYSLSLGGVNVVKDAKIKPAANVPANGSQTVTIPVPVTFENLLAVEEGIRKGGGDIKYGIDAGLDFDTGMPVLGVQRVPFKHEGNLNVKELLTKNMSTILTGPAARKLAEKVLGGMLKF